MNFREKESCMERGKVAKKLYIPLYLACMGVSLLSLALLLPANVAADDLQNCMMKRMQSVDPNMTIADLELQCEKAINDGSYKLGKEGTELAVVTDRIHQDREHVLQPFTIMTHKPNYFIFASYNAQGNDATLWQQFDPNREWDNTEAQFQVSLKFPLLVDLFDDKMDVYAAYTNKSFWQVYNSDSAPFRETNHEPEIWVQFHPDWEFWGVKNTWNSFGFNHQSNGRAGDLSRSWNRIFAWFTVERGNLAMSFKPWIRIPEADDNDDNEDITDFLGNWELSAAYKYKENVFSVMSRNNLQSGFSKGAVELTWSFPLWDWPYLKGYVNYFSGYGRSLIEYDHYSNAIGIGFSVSDWL
jgi:phospholipase A1